MSCGASSFLLTIAQLCENETEPLCKSDAPTVTTVSTMTHSQNSISRFHLPKAPKRLSCQQAQSDQLGPSRMVPQTCKTCQGPNLHQNQVCRWHQKRVHQLKKSLVAPEQGSSIRTKLGNKLGALLNSAKGRKLGPSLDSMPGSTQGSTKGINEGKETETLEHKKHLWKSLKHGFIGKLDIVSTIFSIETSISSIDTSSATSTSSVLDSNRGTLIDLSPAEMTSKTFVCLTNSANVQSDPTESVTMTPVDSESNKTAPATNESNQTTDPPQPLITLDSPKNVDEPVP